MSSNSTMNAFTKICRVGTVNLGRKNASVFVKIEYKDGRLSLVGVVGPTRGGNAEGGCGQIYSTLRGHVNPAKGWTKDIIWRLYTIWERYHLNDMNPGTPAQMEFIRKAKHLHVPVPTEYTERCKWLAERKMNPDPTTGEEYGTKWWREEVPNDVLELLYALPDADRQPAWI